MPKDLNIQFVLFLAAASSPLSTYKITPSPSPPENEKEVRNMTFPGLRIDYDKPGVDMLLTSDLENLLPQALYQK